MKNSKSGILAFECSQDNYEPNVLHFWERYDGNRSMGLHNTTDEYSKFMRVVRKYLLEVLMQCMACSPEQRCTR